MELHENNSDQIFEKKIKKAAKDSGPIKVSSLSFDASEAKTFTFKIAFEGEAARRILQCESELKERLSKPEMSKVIGAEILTWTEKRWLEIIEENTDIDYFFAQIKKCPDKARSIKLLKALSEKLQNDQSEDPLSLEAAPSPGLSTAMNEELKKNTV